MSAEKITRNFKPGHLYVGVETGYDFGSDEDVIPEYENFGALAFYGADGIWYDADTLEEVSFDYEYYYEQHGAFCAEVL